MDGEAPDLTNGRAAVAKSVVKRSKSAAKWLQNGGFDRTPLRSNPHLGTTVGPFSDAEMRNWATLTEGRRMALYLLSFGRWATIVCVTFHMAVTSTIVIFIWLHGEIL